MAELILINISVNLAHEAGKTLIVAPSVLSKVIDDCFVCLNGKLGTPEEEHPCSVDFPGTEQKENKNTALLLLRAHLTVTG